MAKIKLTKGELKRQRDALEQFRRYLPTLQLKKQQLQMKVGEIRKKWERQNKIVSDARQGVLRWAGVLADPAVVWHNEKNEAAAFDISRYVVPTDIKIRRENVAGAYIPVLDEVIFAAADYDFFMTPFWVDRAVEELRTLTRWLVELTVIEEVIFCFEKELRVTSQRVNLFEKVKIPESLEHIRKITIYLGDQQANAVGISKVAKKKIELVEAASFA